MLNDLYASDPGRWYTEIMYSKSAALVKWLANRYAVPLDRAHIIGHYQVPVSGSGGACATTATNCGGAGHHTDPGNGGHGWQWDHFMSLVRGTSPGSSSSGGTATPVQVVGVAFNAAQGSAARIAGATVKLLLNGAQVATATADSNGYWELNASGTGTYTVRADAAGFACRRGNPSWCRLQNISGRR